MNGKHVIIKVCRKTSETDSALPALYASLMQLSIEPWLRPN